MRWLTTIRLRLRSLLLARRVETELAEEMRLHLDRQIEANIAAGMAPAVARAGAQREMGGVEHWKDACRDARGLATLDSLRQDGRYALRMLRRTPGFTLLGVLVMSLGIGANTAVFSVVNVVLLNPLDYPEPDRIVTVSYGGASAAVSTASFVGQVSAPDATDWQEQNTTFEALAYYTTGRTSVVAGGGAEYGRLDRVRPGFFRVFGVAPALGRPFSPEEEREGGGAAILTASYARQRFGDPSRALGQTLRIGNRPVPVVGVMPDGFVTPDRADLWLPLPDRRTAHRRGNNFRAIGRLKAGVSPRQAQTELTAISERLAKAWPDSVTDESRSVGVTPLHRSMVGDARRMLLLLLGAVGLVLLIACANMATLLMARATARTGEMGVRMAIGASRGRIVRQLLVEGLVHAGLAGGVALVVAVWATRALVALAPGDVPRLADAGLDGRVLLFTFATSVLVSVLFALPPALHVMRTDVADVIGQTGARTVAGGRSRLREGLVIVEIALAVVLLAGGALLVRSLIALQRTPLGFQPQHVLAMETTLPPQGGDRTRTNAFFSGLLEDVAKLPGVVAAGAAASPPGRVESASVFFVDRLPSSQSFRGGRPAVMSIVASGTFAALGMPIRAGRDFTAADRDGAPKVAIVNEALVRDGFRRGENPIGRIIHCTYDSLDPMIIVGVVGDARQYGPAVEPSAECFMPHLQHGYNNTTLSVLVRTAGEPGNLPETVQRLARRRSPDASVRMTTMEAILAERVAAPRFRALLVGLFAALALGLAMAGVYGVMAYTVAQRSTEMAVRMALGATARHVCWMMVRRGMALTAVGLALGSLGAVAATRLLAGMLYGISPGDAATHGSALVMLAALSLIATYIPARRATRVEPLRALREG